MSVEETMRVVQLEGELQDMSLRAAQIRKFLAGALCAVCGEPLGESEELTQEAVENDEPRTIHKRCERGEQCRECGRNLNDEGRCAYCVALDKADADRQDVSSD